MLDNTDSDVLTLLPKNGFSTASQAAAPRKAELPGNDETEVDDSCGLASGIFSMPQTASVPVAGADETPVDVSAPASAAGRAVPKFKVPPKLAIPGKGAGKNVGIVAPRAVPVQTVEKKKDVAPLVETPAQGGGKVLFNVSAPAPKKQVVAAQDQKAEALSYDDDVVIRRGPSEEFLQVGQIIGQYVIEEKLPPKGNFLRFKIFHTKLQVHREIHLLNPQIIYEKEKLPSYFQERVSKFSSLPHPNLRNVLYVVNEPQNGLFGIVLESVQSGTLADDPEFGKMPIEKAKRIIIAVATALSYFELVGITHGFINARNITRSEDGRDIKLDGMMDIYSFSGGGLHGGNFQGIQRDLYSAGLLFYEMLTGQQPPTQNALKTVNLDPRVHAPEIPGDIAVLIIRLLAPSAMTRFSSAADFLLSAQALTSTQNVLSSDLLSGNREVSRALKDFSIWKIAAVILSFFVALQILRCIDNCGSSPVTADPEYTAMQKAYVEEATRTEDSLESFRKLLSVWDKEIKLNHRKERTK